MLSQRCSDVNPSPTVMLNRRVAELRRNGVEIISLNIGEPDFPTPQHIKDAANEAINKNFTKYPPSNGYFELREAISKKLSVDNHLSYTPDEINVSNGAKQAVYNAILAVSGPGDEVIIPAPCWTSFPEMVKLAGAKPVLVSVDKENGYNLDLDIIKKAITSKTKAIIINTPNNPTGAVYSEETLRNLAELAVKHEFIVIADEVYEKLVFKRVKHFSIASISPEVRDHVITINGVSKTYAMTGWRIGYSAAPLVIAKSINAFQSHMTSGACSISQKAAYAALTGPKNDLEKMHAEYDRRRIFMTERINQLPGITCNETVGAFYLFPDISQLIGKRWRNVTINNSIDLAELLLEEMHVAMVPGEVFYAPNHLRISYSNSMENLIEGMKRFASILKALE